MAATTAATNAPTAAAAAAAGPAAAGVEVAPATRFRRAPSARSRSSAVC